LARLVGPPPAAIVAKELFHLEPRGADAIHHFRQRQRPERQRERMFRLAAADALDERLVEDREFAASILTDRLDERELPAARPYAAHADFLVVLAPGRQVRHQVDAEQPARAEHAV